MKAIMGRKVGMTRVIESDKLVAATLVMVGPNHVAQIKTTDRDGYNAIQLSFDQPKRANKPQRGHTKKAKVNTGRYFVELRTNNVENITLGQELGASTFEVGDIIDVIGQSKGKGFAGTVKRHNFTTGPKSHGSMNVRRPGSIGAQQPQRVVKGRRMGGHMGDERVTTKHLKVLDVLADQNLLVIKGAIPGIRGAKVLIKLSSAKEGK